MLNEIDLQILRFVFEARTPTASDIFDAVFRGSKSHATMYKKLRSLEDQKLIAKKALYLEAGAASPNYYRLTASGARAIGIEKIPSTHYRYQMRMYYNARLARKRLNELVILKNWMLVDSDHQCRLVINLYLQELAKQQGHNYLSSITLKILPDLVLYTGTEAIIVVIVHPNAGRGACRQRLVKYESLINEVRILCIHSDEDQKMLWDEVISLYDADHKTQYLSRIKMIMPSQIGEIPRLIR